MLSPLTQTCARQTRLLRIDGCSPQGLSSLWAALTLPRTPLCTDPVPVVQAAAAAKSLQSCPTLQPHRQQPTRLPRPWDSPGKNTGVGCHFLLQCMKVKSESEVAQSCPTLFDPMDCSLPGSSVHGFSRQEYWSGVPLPSPCSLFRLLLKHYDLERIYLTSL